MQELLAFALQQLRYRDARPPGHHLGDLVLAHVVPEERILLFGGLALLAFQLLLELGELPVFQGRSLVEVVLVLGLFDLLLDGFDLLPELLNLVDALLLVLPVGLHGVEGVPEGGELLADLHQVFEGRLIGLLAEGRLLDLQLHDLPGDLVHLRGHGVYLRLDHGAGFVHEIDGLIRQKPVGDVAVREHGGSDQGFVPDLHAVEDLVPGLQATEDGDGVLHAGFRHQHRLEPALQSRVLLDVLSILVQRGGADAVELTPGQHGLENVAGIHGALGLARAHDGVELVDEQDDLPLAMLDFGKDGFQPFLELAPVFCSGHQGAHIQGEQLPVLQIVGHVAPADSLGEALRDGGLAHAGFADEAGVILGLPGQDADDAADLGIPADDRVQLLVLGEGRQILTVLLQHVVGVLGVVGVHLASAPDLLQGGEVALHSHVVPAEQARQILIGLRDKAHHQVLHRDVAVAHLLHALLGLVQRPVQGC